MRIKYVSISWFVAHPRDERNKDAHETHESFALHTVIKTRILGELSFFEAKVTADFENPQLVFHFLEASEKKNPGSLVSWPCVTLQAVRASKHGYDLHSVHLGHIRDVRFLY